MELPAWTTKTHHDVYPGIDPTRKELSAAGKVIFITGGGTSIGMATAHQFAKAGAADIILLGRRESLLTEAKKSIEAAGGKTRVHIYAADITNEARMREVVAEVHSKIGPINAFIANAGFMPDPAPVADASLDDMWLTFEINVKGTIISARAFLKHAAEDAVFVSTNTAVAHLRYLGPTAAYGASKLASARYIDALSAENPSYRFYNVHPGIVQTDMVEKAEMKLPLYDSREFYLDPFLRHLCDNHADFFGNSTANLPGAFAVWLASPEAAFLKGRFLHAQWDVDEMKEKAAALEDPDFLTVQLNPWKAFEGKIAYT
ncbi:hypothetical protein MMC25_004912 [Agyrium rufum]|nr:hypothetical protein [Agyrium rufum]